jgi:Chromo (CHRromatin Organisation MOdifier) domain
MTWYLVKWKGFADKDSTWEKNGDIGAELVDEFEASYKGNHFAKLRLSDYWGSELDTGGLSRAE